MLYTLLLFQRKIATSKDGYFDVFKNISLSTLEVILKCAFSYKDDIQNLG